MALTPDQAQGRASLPAGGATATYLGDLIAVAADTAVVLYEPTAKELVRSIEVSGQVTAVAFSPSGHRLYVARGKGDVQVFDRLSSELILTIELPGTARDLRSDFFGSWLLARPERGDSVWIVDATTGKLAGTAPARWSPDLPAVAGTRTLLVRAGPDVKALDLGSKKLAAVGSVAGGAEDLWLPLSWLPPLEQQQLAENSDTSAEAADSSAAVPGIFLQVSSSRNPSWANELAGKLKAAGLPASVLPPKSGEDAYRVVLGPYTSRDQAEATGKSLGMPSFVITPQDQAPQ
jgi:hypothetical protein